MWAFSCALLVLVLGAGAAGALQAAAPGPSAPPAPGVVSPAGGGATLGGPTSVIPGGAGPGSVRGSVRHLPPFRPNVLLVVADDLGTDVVGAYGVGGDIPATPNLDALAAEGVLFRNAWAAANCSPARAMIQTGRHGFRTGIGTVVDQVLSIGGTLSGLPLDEITIPEMLAAGSNGAYRSASIGKWHLGDDMTLGGVLAPNFAGYDHFAGALSNLKQPDTYFAWTRVEDGVPATSLTYATTAAVDDALAFIQSTPAPWFCHLAFHAPHSPYHDPPAGLHSQDLSGHETVRQFRAMVEALDTELGRLLDALPPHVRERTTVLVLGDNGTPGTVIVAPQDPTKGKGTLYEGGVKVPLIVSGWGVGSPGRETDDLVSAVDLFPTIAGLAGVDLAGVMGSTTLDGVDLGPLLADPGVAGTRTHVLAEIFNPNGVPAAPFPGACNPIGPVCQPDIGFGGPGTATLTVCGDELWGGHDAELAVAGGIPNELAFLFLSFGSAPAPFMGGTLAAFPPIDIAPYLLDGNGNSTTTILGGVGFGTMTYQVMITDVSQPQGFAFTNAVQVNLHPADLKTIRDDRWKLVLNVYTCEERFHDLTADPDEVTDLLAAPLNTEQQTAYDGLSGAMSTLVNSL